MMMTTCYLIQPVSFNSSCEKMYVPSFHKFDLTYNVFLAALMYLQSPGILNIN
jgi:hypothetical protein